MHTHLRVQDSRGHSELRQQKGSGRKQILNPQPTKEQGQPHLGSLQRSQGPETSRLRQSDPTLEKPLRNVDQSLRNLTAWKACQHLEQRIPVEEIPAESFDGR